MEKIAIGVLAFLLGGAMVYIALDYFGVTPQSAPSPPNATVINISPELLTSLSSSTDNTSVEQIMNQMDEIDISIYGLNGETAQSVMDWYNSINTQNGWTLVRTAQDSVNGWVGVAYGWQKGATGMLVAAWSGSEVVDRTGYDCVVVTATAPMWVWESIMNPP